MTVHKCSAPDCANRAAVEVRLYDVYWDGEVRDDHDYTCPYLCAVHVAENEEGARGERVPRGFVGYPYSNQHRGHGFTIYRNLDNA